MKQPPQVERESLEKMSQPVLVDVILRQQESIDQLFAEVTRLKGIINRNSSDSSKPPSSDFLKKSEIAKAETAEVGKRKAGGQPGHPGATRKGFGQVDRFEVIKPQECPQCGGQTWIEIGVKTRQCARLVEKPIEVVAYQQHQSRCQNCAMVVWGKMPAEVIQEQDLEASLQGMLVWLGSYGHLSYEQIDQEMVPAKK
jgi:transposase